MGGRVALSRELLAEWDRLDWRNKLDLLWRSTAHSGTRSGCNANDWRTKCFKTCAMACGCCSSTRLHGRCGAHAGARHRREHGDLHAAGQGVDSPVACRAAGATRRFRRGCGGRPGNFSYPMYANLRDATKVRPELVAYFQQPFSLSDGIADRTRDRSDCLRQLLRGARRAACIGTLFSAGRRRTPGTHPVVVISHGLWRRRFGADPAVIGKASASTATLTVVGVAPSEFTGTTRGTVNDVYVPGDDAGAGAARTTANLPIRFRLAVFIGRLKP